MKIVTVSDVVIGYGSPQVPLLAESLRQFYRGDVHVVEPVQPELALHHLEYPAFQFHRVTTAEHPHTAVGRIEYVRSAARVVNRLAPDVLVVCCTYALPVLFRLRRRPRKVLYYCYETVPSYGDFDVEMNRHAAPLLDLVLFPEQNRAFLEVRRCVLRGVPALVVYNVSNRRADGGAARAACHRNGRILYGGTIGPQTFLDYYASDEVRTLPIDMFGQVKGEDADRERLLAGTGGMLRYRGIVSASELAALRPAYSYSIVAWKPDVENQRFAAPNKFFEAIADGVPPIAAPHPQCRLLLERYACGLVMPDWSLEGFVATLRRAIDADGTNEWQEMVDNCARAVASELTWDAQFEKIEPYL